MAANAKERLLAAFKQGDPECSGSIGKDGLELLLLSELPEMDRVDMMDVLKLNTNPTTGGLDYERFITWLFGSAHLDRTEPPGNDQPLAVDQGQQKVAPVLAPALQKLLANPPTTQVTNQEANIRPPVVLMDPAEVKKIQQRKDSKQKPLPALVVNPESLMTGPMVAPELESTITGRTIVQAPPQSQVAGTSPEEFQAIIQKSAATGVALEQFNQMISEDIFGLPFSVSIAIPTVEDTPLVAISDGFIHLTGYSREEIVGRNCRFLLEGVPKDEVQDQTRVEARRYCRAAYLKGLTRLSHTFLIQRNARKNGECFWNLFMLSMVPGPGTQTFIVGLQLDLGPKLDLTEGQDIAAVIEPHKRNLQIVQQLIFGQKVQHDPLSEPTCPAMKAITDVAAGLGLADDVMGWIREAEDSSSLFQTWGTLPLAVWPMTSKYAVVNGGATLIRLEAVEVVKGGVAMSIFPIKKAPMGCSFKVRIDEVCDVECDVSKGGWLPSFGFTHRTPAMMDEIGGLPSLIESTAQSVCLRGDGYVFVRDEEVNCAVGEAPSVEVVSTQPASPYVVTVGDILECTWGKGLLVVSAEDGDGDGTVVYSVKDTRIPKPPKKKMFALIDCCHGACKMTLVS